MNSENTITPCHHHRQEETRTLIRDSLSLSLCVHSLSLCVLVLLLFVFTFHPQKWALDTKIKTLFPPLSLSFLDESIRSSSAQMIRLCNQRTPRVLHKQLIRVVSVFFVIIAARCLFFVHTREREREREKERKRRARKNDGRKFCIYKNTRNVEKKQVVATAFLPRLERERDRLRNTLHNHAVFCHTSTFTYFAFLLIIIAY